MPSLFDDWLLGEQPESHSPNLWIYREQSGTREGACLVLREAILDHMVGLDIIERMGGFQRAAVIIRNRLPVVTNTRSGDLGEILASEYVVQKTDYQIPVKRLRHKDDRDTTMRGDDVIGIRITEDAVSLLKGEAKSRISIGASVVEKASAGLMRHAGRPNPSSLAFISTKLREEGNDNLAEVFEKLQTTKITDSEIEHLIFTLSGNDPLTALSTHVASPVAAIRRHVVGVVIADHQDFIGSIFQELNAGNS